MMSGGDKRRGRLRPPGDKTMTAQSARDDRSSLLLEDRITRVFRELPGAVAGQEEPVHQVRVAGGCESRCRSWHERATAVPSRSRCGCSGS